MSLLDRIADEEYARRQEEDAAAAAKSDEDSGRRQRRADIVTAHIQSFASSLNEAYAELPPLSSTRYFVVGGLVLAVRERSNIPKEQRLITDSRDVLWQHTVALAGVTLFGNVREVDARTLQLVQYESLVKAFELGQRDVIQFDHASVVSALYPTPN